MSEIYLANSDKCPKFYSEKINPGGADILDKPARTKELSSSRFSGSYLTISIRLLKL